MLRFVGVVQLCFVGRAPGILSGAENEDRARFLGYGFGMFVAARDPLANVAWINTMIVIQIADWLSTIGYLLAHDVSFSNVAPAAVLPVVFVGGLLLWHPGRLARLDRVTVAAAPA